MGFFTLTEEHRAAANRKRIGSSSWASRMVAPFEGQPIRAGQIMPSSGSLRKHWERIEFVPRSFPQAVAP